MPKESKDLEDLLKLISDNSWQTAVFLLFAALAASVYVYYTDIQDLESRVLSLEGDLAQANSTIDTLEDDKAYLYDELTAEKNRINAAQDILDEITGTVGNLQKLAELDTELLQKYSKVYFLNENYVPPGFTEIEKEYLYDESETEHIHRDVWSFLRNLLEAAYRDDIDLWIVSAYRSFEEQSSLKSNYTITYGSGANAFSADQGYSEHQLGTTVDFTTTGLGGGLRGFETTEAYEWLLDNAHRYGFTLSYPEGNQFYIFEPWHWRFVGKDLADDLHGDDQFFYDLPQRDIDEYLLEIFD